MIDYKKPKVGDIIVSLSVTNTRRKIGDLFEIDRVTSFGNIYYTPNWDVKFFDINFRFATEEEIKYYNFGYKNINDIFKKGEYYVCLRPKEKNSIYIKYNWCYKQIEDSVTLCPKRSSFYTSNFNTRSVSIGAPLEILKDWVRPATSKEIIEYNRLDKPYDVTTLDKSKNLSYKFAPGDKVVVILRGYGIGEEYVGYIVTILEQALYSDEKGYRIKENYGNSRKTEKGNYIGFNGFIGEKAFMAVPKDDLPKIKYNSYKFEPGDVVKVISSGYDIANIHIGELVTIKKQGIYDGLKGYIIEESLGNSRKDSNGNYINFNGFIGESSFAAVSKNFSMEVKTVNKVGNTIWKSKRKPGILRIFGVGPFTEKLIEIKPKNNSIELTKFEVKRI